MSSLRCLAIVLLSLMPIWLFPVQAALAAAADRQPPVITPQSHSGISFDSVTITWKTDEPATSQEFAAVRYALAPGVAYDQMPHYFHTTTGRLHRALLPPTGTRPAEFDLLRQSQGWRRQRHSGRPCNHRAPAAKPVIPRRCGCCVTGAGFTGRRHAHALLVRDQI